MEKSEVVEDWKVKYIVAVHKKKGDGNEPVNYGRINMVNVTGKLC